MDAILTKWVGLFLTGLKLAAASIVGRVMAAVGLTWVNFAYTLPNIKSWVAEKFSGLDQTYLDIITASGIDIAMTLVISAIIARVGVRVFTASASALEALIGQEQGA